MITDNFIYFSKFVPLAVLDKIFPTTTADKRITDLKTIVQNLPATDRQDTISHYLFGCNINILKNQIRNTKGVVLMVCYNDIYEKNRIVNTTTTSPLEVFVITPYDAKNTDMLSDMMLMYDLLNITTKIKKILQDDNRKRCCNALLIDSDIRIKQIDDKNFYNILEINCIGWVLTFETKVVYD